MAGLQIAVVELTDKTRGTRISYPVSIAILTNHSGLIYMSLRPSSSESGTQSLCGPLLVPFIC